MPAELTTVADDLVVVHDGTEVHRYDGLHDDAEYGLHGFTVRTLPRPSGARLATVVTVNDVHFGETECGRVDDHPDGPIIRPEPGAQPYPEMMNRAAVAEIAALQPDAVIVKGDLTQDGTQDEWEAFESCYRTAFGERLHVVRGNHDSYRGQDAYAGDHWISVPGLHIALVDTAIPTRTTGTLGEHQLGWIDDHLAGAARAGERTIVMGHHQQWIPGGDGMSGATMTTSDSVPTPAMRSTPCSPGTRQCSGTPPATPTGTACGGWRSAACRRSRSVASRTFPVRTRSIACTRAV
jgi:3',5'-cyclic-AMP phosphodiesterase